MDKAVYQSAICVPTIPWFIQNVLEHLTSWMVRVPEDLTSWKGQVPEGKRTRLKTKSHHDANFSSLVVLEVVVPTTFGAAYSGKVGIMIILGF